MSVSTTAAPPVPTKPLAPSTVTDFESVRLAHLKTEGWLKTTGAYYIFLGFLGTFVAVCYVLGKIVRSGAIASEESSVLLQISAVVVLIAAFSIHTGSRLRKLSPSSKKPATILAILGLFLFPLGTLISLPVLFVLVSKKSVRIFSDDYAEIIRETPQHSSRVSRLFIVCAILLAVIVVPVNLVATITAFF